MVLQAWAGAKEASPLPLIGAENGNLLYYPLHIMLGVVLVLVESFCVTFKNSVQRRA